MLHCFKSFTLSTRVLQSHSWNWQVIYAVTILTSLFLYVTASLWNHLDPDLSNRELSRVAYTYWPLGIILRQRQVFCLVATFLAIPELLTTCVLYQRSRVAAAARPLRKDSFMLSVKSLINSAKSFGRRGLAQSDEARGNDQVEVELESFDDKASPMPVEAASMAESEPSAAQLPKPDVTSLSLDPVNTERYGRCWLIFMLMMVSSFAFTGLIFVSVSFHDPLRAPQLIFMQMLSSSMTTRITAPCNASGTITASPRAVCNLWFANCTDDMQLSGLNLAGHYFHGSIPSIDTSDMHTVPQYLTTLDLSSNQLSGTLPTTIGRLSSLEVLRIGGNALSGPLPTELENLRALEHCELTSDFGYINFPDNVFDCRNVPGNLPHVCGDAQCHLPLAPPSPPSPPSAPPVKLERISMQMHADKASSATRSR